MRRVFFILFTVSMVFLGGLPPAYAKDRPKIGLALSGGGARGAAHVGVLRELERLHIPIDYIAGSSIGSIVGAAYAAGYTPDEIQHFFESADWQRIFSDAVDRRGLIYRRKLDHRRYLFDFEVGLKKNHLAYPTGLVSGHNVSLWLQDTFLRVANIEQFDQLAIPFRAVATDIERGEAVVLSRGNLAEAVRASSAIPAVFAPVELDGKLLTDGGSTNNLPVDVLRAMGADVVIAVDVSLQLSPRNKLDNLFTLSEQTAVLAVLQTAEAQKKRADVVVVPALEDSSMFDFSVVRWMVDRGAQSVRSAEADLKRYSLLPQDYSSHLEHRSLPHFAPKQIASVTIEGTRRADRRVVDQMVEVRPGDPFDLPSIKRDLNQVYGLGDFQKVDVVVKPKADGADLTIRASEKPWGPNYLRFNFNMFTEIEGQTEVNALGDLIFTRLNSYGGEWRTDLQLGTTMGIFSEFFQPFDYDGLFFIAPSIRALRTSYGSYVGTDHVADYGVDSATGQFDLGLQFGKFGELRAGYRGGVVHAGVKTGVAVFAPHTDAISGIATGFHFDRLDSVYFPRRGFTTALNFFASRSELGASATYRTFTVEWAGFLTHSKHTIFSAMDAGTSFGDSLPIYDEFQVGGFSSLSGFHAGEQRGEHYGVGRAGYFYRLPVVPNFLYDGVSLGGWAEAGHAWRTSDNAHWRDLDLGGAIALGLDTKLGALYLAYGQSGISHFQFYISMGRPFLTSAERWF